MKTLWTFVAANGIIGGSYYALAQLLHDIATFPYKAELILFYSIQSFMIAGLWQWSKRLYPLQGLLAIMLLRLVTSATFLGLRLYGGIQPPTQYVIHFAILYFAYMVFELAFFLSKLKPPVQPNKTITKEQADA